MQVQKIVEHSENYRAAGSSETLETLLKAQSGIIPLTALQYIKLEENEVAVFLARELLFLRTIADGAKMSMLAILFDELHLSLLDSAAAKIKGNG